MTILSIVREGIEKLPQPGANEKSGTAAAVKVANAGADPSGAGADAPPKQKTAAHAELAAQERSELKAEFDGFCIYPFKSLNVTPQGTIKPCCAFWGELKEGGRALSVYETPFPELWNSQSMRDIRRAFVEGREVEACKYCFDHERSGVSSMRIAQTAGWVAGYRNPDGESIDMLKARAVANGFESGPAPEWFDLDVGNVCNLKCRMCNSTFSSRIASDPVHSRWTPLHPVNADWRGKELVVAPRQMLGVAYEGLEYAANTMTPLSWSDGNAAVRLNLKDIALESIAIKLHADHPDGHPLEITANGAVLFSGPMPAGTWQRQLDASALKDLEELEIRIVSPLFVREGGGQEVGVGVEEIRLVRAGGGEEVAVRRRFSGGGAWFRDREFLTQELLANPHSVKALNVIGGEPLLIKEVRVILRHLIETGAAEKVHLVATTNGTYADDEWFELSAKFASFYAALSIDGHGKVNEYIRAPSKWAEVEQNLKRFRDAAKTKCDLNVTLQIYNMFGVVDLFEFCDANGLTFRIHTLQYPMEHNPLMLPIAMRRRAAEKLREFIRKRGIARPGWAWLDAAGANSSDAVLAAAAALEGGDPAGDPWHVNRFMQFTNDLDRSRGQDWRLSLPDLASEFDNAGIVWNDETVFAQRPALPAAAE